MSDGRERCGQALLNSNLGNSCCLISPTPGLLNALNCSEPYSTGQAEKMTFAAAFLQLLSSDLAYKDTPIQNAIHTHAKDRHSGTFFEKLTWGDGCLRCSKPGVGDLGLKSVDAD